MKGRTIFRKKSGSMMVEAAIFVPAFICAALTLAMLLKICLLQVMVYSAQADQTSLYAIDSILSLSYGIREELEDYGVDADAMKVKVVPHVTGLLTMDGLEKVECTYDAEVALPISFVENIYIKNTILTRKWKGSDIESTPFGFDRMKVDGDWEEVLVFPRAGGRFHKKGCRYVESYAKKTTFSESIKKSYSPCPLCTDGNEAYGQTIYTFEYGSSYHRASCYSVEKYVISMDHDDAVKKGYTACSVCGG